MYFSPEEQLPLDELRALQNTRLASLVKRVYQTVPFYKKQFDAIVLCGGSTIPRDLPIPGRDLEGVYFAMEFLKKQNKTLASESKDKDEISAKGKDVVVIGGGDTGSDCVGTSNRHGAKSVTQIEIMDKPPVPFLPNS